MYQGCSVIDNKHYMDTATCTGFNVFYHWVLLIQRKLSSSIPLGRWATCQHLLALLAQGLLPTHRKNDVALTDDGQMQLKKLHSRRFSLELYMYFKNVTSDGEMTYLLQLAVVITLNIFLLPISFKAFF